MSNNDLLSVQEVAVVIKSSVPTISSWYRWKNKHPKHELAQMLPNFERHGAHRARYWRYSDIPKLIDFKNAIPQGRNGVMGDITQAYCKDNFRNRDKNKK